MGPIGGPETSPKDYYYTLRNIPAWRKPPVVRGGSMKSRYFFHTSQIATLLAIAQHIISSKNL